ncbi:Uncharacterised protein [Clostridium baratii]|uniref:hypothetical protein n=1 Tax=Clostridium baratii TaxID=1561 RepID=UPI0006C26201|nr:hypothetical protein [Clostridium baratii]CUO91089.1 Uncharacterised protein [Clostridium baratii]
MKVNDLRNVLSAEKVVIRLDAAKFEVFKSKKVDCDDNEYLSSNYISMWDKYGDSTIEQIYEEDYEAISIDIEYNN